MKRLTQNCEHGVEDALKKLLDLEEVK